MNEFLLLVSLNLRDEYSETSRSVWNLMPELTPFVLTSTVFPFTLAVAPARGLNFRPFSPTKRRSDCATAKPWLNTRAAKIFSKNLFIILLILVLPFVDSVAYPVAEL